MFGKITSTTERMGQRKVQRKNLIAKIFQFRLVVGCVRRNKNYLNNLVIVYCVSNKQFSIGICLSELYFMRRPGGLELIFPSNRRDPTQQRITNDAESEEDEKVSY